MYQQAPVFTPTLEEFQDFSKFVSSIWPKCESSGICKVIPPAGWSPSSVPYDEKIKSIVIPNPILQSLEGKSGIFTQSNMEQSRMTVEEFAKKAHEAEKNAGVSQLTIDEQEEKFWKNVHFSPPLYGADMSGTLFDESVKCWNPQNLGTILNLVGIPLAGITQPYLYFGMWKAMFGWHTEDMDLCSINYLHYGKPKHWYSLPASASSRFETIVAGYFPEHASKCKMFLRHKTTIIKPTILVSRLPVHTCVQNEGEFMLTFPNAYHSGFNHGLNCAESVNFATKEWIPYGIKSKPCVCTPGNASIDMDVFVARHDLFEKFGPDFVPTEAMIWDRMAENGVNISAKLSKLEKIAKEGEKEDKPQTLKRKKSSNNLPKAKKTPPKDQKAHFDSENIEQTPQSKQVLVINWKENQIRAEDR